MPSKCAPVQFQSLQLFVLTEGLQQGLCRSPISWQFQEGPCGCYGDGLEPWPKLAKWYGCLNENELCPQSRNENNHVHRQVEYRKLMVNYHGVGNSMFKETQIGQSDGAQCQTTRTTNCHGLLWKFIIFRIEWPSWSIPPSLEDDSCIFPLYKYLYINNYPFTYKKIYTTHICITLEAGGGWRKLAG